MDRLLQCLTSDTLTRLDLPDCMDALRDTVEQCEKDLVFVEGSFQEWLKIASTLKAVAVDTECKSRYIQYVSNII